MSVLECLRFDTKFKHWLCEEEAHFLHVLKKILHGECVYNPIHTEELCGYQSIQFSFPPA